MLSGQIIHSTTTLHMSSYCKFYKLLRLSKRIIGHTMRHYLSVASSKWLIICLFRYVHGLKWQRCFMFRNKRLLCKTGICIGWVLPPVRGLSNLCAMCSCHSYVDLLWTRWWDGVRRHRYSSVTHVLTCDSSARLWLIVTQVPLSHNLSRVFPPLNSNCVTMSHNWAWVLLWLRCDKEGFVTLTFCHPPPQPNATSSTTLLNLTIHPPQPC